MIAYGSKSVDLKRTSHLMPRDSTGGRSVKEPNTRYKSPRNNRWGVNYDENPRSKSGTTRSSSRTGIRSPIMVGGGRILVVAGQLIPVIAYTYIINDVFSPESKILNIPEQNINFLQDAYSTGSNQWNSLNPSSKFVATVVLRALFS